MEIGEKHVYVSSEGTRKKHRGKCRREKAKRTEKMERQKKLKNEYQER